MRLIDVGSGSEQKIIIIMMRPLLSASRNESPASPSLYGEELLKLAADNVRFIFMPIALKCRTQLLGKF
jgi:hypothetical protein